MVKFEQYIAFGLGVSLGIGITIFFTNRRFVGRGDSKTNPRAFLLSIQISFRNVETKEKFKALFAPFAAFVMNTEAGTLGYELFESDKDDKIVYLFERYKTKHDYLEVHRKTPEFIDFKAKMMQLSENFEMSGQSYYQCDYGYV